MIINFLGNKIGITQIFDNNQNLITITIIKINPCYIINNNNIKNSSFNKINNLKNIQKSNLGIYNKLNLSYYNLFKSLLIKNKTLYKIGQQFTINTLKLGQKITIKGFTIGKGNIGNIKLHKFSRGPMSHGSKHHRLQGSLGAGTTPGRVFPGKKMPGRCGLQSNTIKNLKIIYIDLINNVLFIKGCISGKNGTLLTVITNK